MKFTESPVTGRPLQLRTSQHDTMPIHLNGVLMSSTQFQPVYSHRLGHPQPGQDQLQPRGHQPGLASHHRTASLEMLNNIGGGGGGGGPGPGGGTDFEEKRAFIASTLSLNDLLKPTSVSALSQEFSRGHHQVGGSGGVAVSGGPGAQFSPYMGHATNLGTGSGGYMVPPSLLKPNTNGYNVNFLNNGTPDKDLGKCCNFYRYRFVDLRKRQSENI